MYISTINKGLNIFIMRKNYALSNCLIAAFIGGYYDFVENAYNFSEIEFETIFSNIHQLNFHKSWDWLMPACKKWDELFIGKDLTSQNHVEYVNLCDELDQSLTLYDIEHVYYILIKCIKWYNKNYI